MHVAIAHSQRDQRWVDDSGEKATATVIINKHDEDKSGTIDETELLSMFQEFNKDCSGGLDTKEVRELPKSLTGADASVDDDGGGKELGTLLNDIMNTGITAALVGGFALGNIQDADRVSSQWMDVAVYMLSFLAVHACTCSCLTSAMLYRAANKLSEDEVGPWMQNKALLLQLPWMKFIMGCLSYVLAVITLSFRALEDLPFWRYTALVIGVMSMSTIFIVLYLVEGKVRPPEGGMSAKLPPTVSKVTPST